MSLENFKSFVKTKPELINYVRKKEMSWQEFYNIFELYGPNNSIWDKYTEAIKEATSTFSFKDILGTIKNIDMTELQKGIGSLQKGIGYLQDMVSKRDDITRKTSSYEPRPIHKHFDD